MADEPLKPLTSLIGSNYGAWLEGDVFSILHHSPFVVRSFEFALEDGVIDCTRMYGTHESWSSRFRIICDQEDIAPSLLIPFEVKSSIARNVGEQRYATFTAQRRRAAFYIGICAANPLFVDVIPNYSQDPTALDMAIDGTPGNDEGIHCSVNFPRSSLQPPRAQDGLNQCESPNRVPIWLLPEVMRRIRQRTTSTAPYINPWTEVNYGDWRPISTYHTKWCKPDESTRHFTAYEQAMEIFRAVVYERNISFDFVGLQPRLADFKLGGRLIQHKADTQSRRSKTDFSRVSVAVRDADGSLRHYFRVEERFDFLMYSFECHSQVFSQVILFVPEREIPNHFYISMEEYLDFNCLAPWFIDVDDQLKWVSRILQVIQSTPNPRQPGCRPARPPGNITPRRLPSIVPRPSHSPLKADFLQCHRRFFDGIMGVCARKKSGILLVLSPRHPSGDYAYGRYIWSESDRLTYLRTGRPPQFNHTVPAATTIVPVYYFSSYAESSFRGPTMSAAQLRRLNSCANNRLVCYNIAGPDAAENCILPAVVPSDDIRPTQNQKLRLLGREPATSGTDRELGTEAPSVSAFLSTGLSISEYGFNRGPLTYSSCTWDPLWELLDSFTLSAPFQHPRGAGIQRNPAHYQSSLQSLNQRLHQQHMSNAAETPNDP